MSDIFAAQLADLGATGPNREPLTCRAVNDVNAVALAEHRHGAGREAAHLLVVAATRRGVGSALVLRGALYTGSSGLAMEAGHVSIDPNGRPCPCGSRGCLNVETDAGRFLDAAGRVPGPWRGAISMQAIALLTADYADRPGGYPAPVHRYPRRPPRPRPRQPGQRHQPRSGGARRTAQAPAAGGP